MKTRLKFWLAIIPVFFLTPVVAQSASYQQVQFEGKAFPVSELKQRIAKQKGLPLIPVKPDTLSGHLYKPSADGKHPAIIMVHDCRGIQAYQQDWAKRVAGWGFVVLLLDSFSTRNIESTCQGLGEQENFLIHGGRVQDVFAAYDYITRQEYVEDFRIGLMGWDYHSVLGAVAKHGMQQKFDAGFMGVVAIYPSCNATSGTDFISPILVLVGEEDDWTPAQECRIMERYARTGLESVQLRYYKNAKHGFDDPSLKDETYFPDFRNYFKSPARGVTMQYNRQAHQASIKVIHQFLDFNIKHRPIQITLDDLASEFTEQQIENANWVNHPDDYGPNIPAAGISLFDKTFSIQVNNRWRHDIPFPFDRLMTKLSAVVDQPGIRSSKLKSVLIPSGRSLVRNAAAPDFFEFPRVVVAVDSEPPLRGNHYPIMLKDRLYIAYQEKANALEVISYNETAQRFEFQIVKNYLAGKQPIVEYANRSLCLSCHQNHAPIFANAPWDETNFNEQVFSRIKEKRKNFYGLIPAVPVASAANSIDRSVNRASFLPIYDALWKVGCGADDRRDSIRCRGRAFRAMLQYRLSNKSGFERNTQSFQQNFIKTSSLAWQQHWPNGLAVPAANITDRNPFKEKMEVSARFDPLTPRPPQTIWFGSNAHHLEQVITGLADQIYNTDIRALDKILLSRHEPIIARASYSNDCAIKTTTLRRQTLTASIICKNRNRTEENNFDLHGKLRFNLDDNTVSGQFNSIKRQDEFILHDIRFDKTVIEKSANSLSIDVSVRHKKSPLTVRLPSGDAIVSFTIKLKTDSVNNASQSISADLTFQTVGDFSFIDQAISRMENQGLAKPGTVFSAQPFSAGYYYSQLLAAMNETGIPGYCCEHDPLKLISHKASKRPGAIDLSTATTQQLFQFTCGGCHRTDEPFPPNFLSGNSLQIQRNLKQCAPRIAYRLHMWTLTQKQRKKTPMPPTPPVLDKTSSDQPGTVWPESTVYGRMKDYIIALIESPLSNQQLISELVKTPYQNLDDCTGSAAN